MRIVNDILLFLTSFNTHEDYLRFYAAFGPLPGACTAVGQDFFRSGVIEYVDSDLTFLLEGNMKLPGGLDLESMMRQAQEMQEKMGREMKEMTVEAAAGGGAVTVRMRGDFEVVSLAISPDLVKDGDVEMLQDLTVAALNEARRKVEESLKGKIGGMLPPGMM
jgi:DNA-binding YbaB/EbfC family protein